MALINPNEVKKGEGFIVPVSIIIASFNEEKYVKQKLDSFLDPDEWIPDSEIIVYSCGSTDKTNDLLREYENDERLRIFILEEHLSKIDILNRAVPKAKHDLLVFSDVRQIMKKGSVKALIGNFSDPEVGTVTCMLKDHEKPNRFSLRTILNFTSIWESKMHSCSNVFGALYAQRKSVYRNIPRDLLFDDLYAAVSTLSQRKRLIMEQDAVLYELPFQRYYIIERIQRLTRGLLLCLFQEHKKIKEIPFKARFRFLIFKYFKLLMPFVLLIVGLGSLYFFIHYFSVELLYSISLSLILVFLVKKSRQMVLHLFKINIFFLVSTIKFLVLNSRSNRWEKHIRFINHEKFHKEGVEQSNL